MPIRRRRIRPPRDTTGPADVGQAPGQVVPDSSSRIGPVPTDDGRDSDLIERHEMAVAATDAPALGMEELDPPGEMSPLTLNDVIPRPGRRSLKPSLVAGPIGDAPARFALGYQFPLDPFQTEAIESLARGRSCLVTAPTGTGKTVIAEFALQAAIDRGGRAIYTTPLRALSAQKFRDFVARWGSDLIGMVTGETAVNDRAPILVMTTEILRNRLVSESAETVAHLQSVVLDEFHFLADVERGRVWEEVVLLLPRSVQLVCLSATIPNSAEVQSWLGDVHGPTDLVVHDERAVPLDVWYYGAGRLARVADPSLQVVARPRPPVRHEDDRPFSSRTGVRTDVIESLQRRHFLPAIVFVMSRRRTEEWAAIAVEEGLELIQNPSSRERIERQIAAVAVRLQHEELAVAQLEQLAEALPRGIAFHHAGLVPALRELVERLFEAGLVAVVFATGTLALGINMPARTVVLEQLSTRDDNGWRPLTKREFLQMAGRAGRRGMDTIGHVVAVEHPYDSFQTLEKILAMPPEPISSAFQLDYSSALYLLERYGLNGMIEIYQRSFATYRKLRSAEEVATSGKSGRKGAPTFLVRRQREIQRDVTRQSERLESVLGLYGYWDGGAVTERATFLRRFFHGNALLTSELVIAGTLSELTPFELAEAANWIEGSGRAGRVRRPFQFNGKLATVHRTVNQMARRVRYIEEANSIEVSVGLGPPANHGLVLRAVRGDSLVDLGAYYQLDPGDLYGRLMETEMWLRQLESALDRSGLDPALGLTSRAARRALLDRAGSVGFTPATAPLEDES